MEDDTVTAAVTIALGFLVALLTTCGSIWQLFMVAKTVTAGM